MLNVTLLPGWTRELLAFTAPLESVTTRSCAELPSLTRNTVAPDVTSIALGENLNSVIVTLVEPAGCSPDAPPPPPHAASASTSTSRPVTTAVRARPVLGRLRV